MQIPAQIGKYEILEYLGGGMSRVYRARDTVIGRIVVVKVLTDEACADSQAKARFLQEARTAGTILHENIIRIYDFGEDAGGRPYMVMEFLTGEDLRALIKNGRAGDLPNKIRIAAQIAAALEHIHSERIIHRDIKPENVHVNPDGVVKLMDFGIAKAPDMTLTAPGLTMGTPYYMAPEQVLGRDVTHLVDIYAFGILLFELVTGTRPLKADSIEQLFAQILSGSLNLEPLKQAGIPEPLADLVATLVAKDPARRPQSFAAVRHDLQGILDSAQKPAAPVKPKRPWVVPAAALGLLLVAGLVYVLFPRESARRELDATIETPSGNMVLVRGGPFRAGKDGRSESLPDFYIDQTEVTNAAYARFCREKGRPLPEGFPAERPNFPAVHITFVDAQEFAKWADKRLPSGLEWEKASRGQDARLYPWGKDQNPALANVRGNPAVKTPGLMPVGSFPLGESPAHALDMVGNAWEFVNEFQTPSRGALSAFKSLLA
ncbi:MAG: bifunctional serine/threonine-protein kinase/formylglycine-generating enzyme family protein, partial [Acidobacteria bacterium]|nr:bifunctional serine/threonine-protein kinase/formylglycine-generating enzyme family protein [Acidobacteriota bacterium]